MSHTRCVFFYPATSILILTPPICISLYFCCAAFCGILFRLHSVAFTRCFSSLRHTFNLFFWSLTWFQLDWNYLQHLVVLLNNLQKQKRSFFPPKKKNSCWRCSASLSLRTLTKGDDWSIYHTSRGLCYSMFLLGDDIFSSLQKKKKKNLIGRREPH